VRVAADSVPHGACMIPPPKVKRPEADRDTIRRTFTAIVGDSLVHEARGLEVMTGEYAKPHTESGYFDDVERAVEAAIALGKRSGNVYTTLNPVNTALLARARNRTKFADRGSTTSDHDIEGRTRLLIDFDPCRPAGISATDAEKEAAYRKALEVRDFLTGLGWPAPVLADSGNGYHLIYRIDLPNDDDSTALVKAVLEALDAIFSD
jgi:hypothetical protein